MNKKLFALFVTALMVAAPAMVMANEHEKADDKATHEEHKDGSAGEHEGHEAHK